ncbi:MAG: type VI secretion system tip protein TssI/VgrG [Desulfobacteraceae bacterium]|nr:type VI secretion system tip protein TssI/VgrG [Desulfobacteraceae bacterium]
MTSPFAANESRFFFETAGTQFLVIEFSAVEKISTLFEVRLALASEKEMDVEKLIGRPGVLRIEGLEESRYFHGFIRRFSHCGSKGRFLLYRATLAPQAYLLSLRSDCRIFQELNAPDIIRQVLTRAGVPGDLYTFRLQTPYKQREYCVQYRETDLHFIQRLCAEEGIFFFFEHSPDRHLMVFGDGTVNYQPICGSAALEFNEGGGMAAGHETIRSFKQSRQVRSAGYSACDFNFQKPSLELSCQKKIGENGTLALYDYPGCYQIPEHGQQAVGVRLEQALMYKDLGAGQSDVPRLMPGFTFKLSGHPVQSLDQEYLLIEVRHTGRQPQVLAELAESREASSYLNAFETVTAQTVIRPDPMAKPFVQGVQTAMVTGPAGQEIYTDAHGRVKVQFHWDREGQKNEKSSCWLRVSQNWAGAAWGSIFLPRIGQEVIVDFLEGDPDRPIITGRVYNGDNLPPYGLPDEKSITAIQSLSTPGGEGFNELRFQDRKGAEQLFMHAERDMDLRINNDRRTWVGNDCHLIVKKNLHAKIRGPGHTSIKGNSSAQVQGHYSLTIKGDLQEKVSGGMGLAAGAQIHISAGTDLVLEAKTGLSLKAGAGFITIDSAGVAMGGPAVHINSGGAPGAGRGVFTQPSAAPLVAALGKPGQVEVSQAKVPASAPQLTPALIPSPVKAETPPLEMVYAHFRKKNGTMDSQISFENSYELDGPKKIKSPEHIFFAFSAIRHEKLPAGSYTLSFKKFATGHEALKPTK